MAPERVGEAKDGNGARRPWPRRLTGRLRRQAGRLAGLLAGPRGAAARPDSAGLQRARLLQGLEDLLRPLAGQSELGRAVLEGALALAMADGRFGDEEWLLFQRGMALLDLPQRQQRDLSLHGEVDLEAVCTVLAGLDDPAASQAIADFYRLMCAADGERASAELRTLERLLQALCRQSHPSQSLPSQPPPSPPLAGAADGH